VRAVLLPLISFVGADIEFILLKRGETVDLIWPPRERYPCSERTACENLRLPPLRRGGEVRSKATSPGKSEYPPTALQPSRLCWWVVLPHLIL